MRRPPLPSSRVGPRRQSLPITKRLPYREDLEKGDKVFKNVTEAIRWKYRLSHVRGRLQTKCPNCQCNIPHGQDAEHREHCPAVILTDPPLSRPQKRKRRRKSLMEVMRAEEAAKAKARREETQ